MKDFNWQLLGDYTENIIISLFVILLIGLEIWIINRGSNYLKKKILGFKSNLLKIQSIELINLGKQQLIVIGLINFFRISAIILSINFSLLFILSLFPETKELVTKLLDFIFVPLKSLFYSVVDFLPKLFAIIIIVIIFRYLFKLVKTLAKAIEKGTIKTASFNPRWVKTTAKIINFLLLAFLLIWIIPLMPGYESLAFKGIATFLAALITIGGSSVIANYMSGIVISYMHPCKVGDRVKIENTIGEVMELSPFAIKIQTAKKIAVSIPYTKSLSSHIINYSGEQENHNIILQTTVSIGYSVKWEKVNELLISAASLTEFINHSKPAFVRQIKLDDFYVVYELNAYTAHVEQMQHIYSELHKNILDVFNKAGVEILSPHYEAHK